MVGATPEQSRDAATFFRCHRGHAETPPAYRSDPCLTAERAFLDNLQRPYWAHTLRLMCEGIRARPRLPYICLIYEAAGRAMTCLNGDGWQPALPRKVQGHGREKHPCQSAFCIKETVGTETDGINGQGRSSAITLHHHRGKHRHLLETCYITA